MAGLESEARSINLLKQNNLRLQNAFDNSVRSARIANELYWEGRTNYHFSNIHSLTSIDAYGDGIVKDTLSIVADEKPLHLWKSTIWVEKEAKEVPFLEQLDLEVEDITGGDLSIVFLPVQNEGRRKEFCIFFLPHIKPHEHRTIQITYQWPGYVLGFLKTKKVDFEWDY
ncbi:MAG: hypothetical protein ACREBC_37315, partial [Pyrinomonadaceae bacterium]